MLQNPEKAMALEGRWRHPDTSAEYTIRVLKTKVIVSGIDSDDGEEFAVLDVAWDGNNLTFTSLMPSTRWKVVHRIKPNRGQTIRHEFTCVETWKKKRCIDT